MQKSILFADWWISLLAVMAYFVSVGKLDAAAPAEKCPAKSIEARF